MKTRLAVFVNVVNVHSTVREVEVHWTEFGVFNFCVLQIAILNTFLFICV